MIKYDFKKNVTYNQRKFSISIIVIDITQPWYGLTNRIKMMNSSFFWNFFEMFFK